MAAITICSDFGAQEDKVCHCFHCFPIYLPWSDGTGCHDVSFYYLDIWKWRPEETAETFENTWIWEVGHWEGSESESHSVMPDSLWPHGLYSPRNSLGQNTGMGGLSLLYGIFPTQGTNPGLPHCMRILYQLSYEGSPRILEWVAYPFSSGSSQPRNQTTVSYIAGGFFTNWAIREASGK